MSMHELYIGYVSRPVEISSLFYSHYRTIHVLSFFFFLLNRVLSQDFNHLLSTV